MKLTKMKAVVKQEDGTEKTYTNFYLQLENGSYIAIKPSFIKDYKVLYVLAQEVSKEEKPF